MRATSPGTTTSSVARPPRPEPRRLKRRRSSTATTRCSPVLAGHYTHSFGSATLFELKGGGIYIRDNFTPYTDDFVTSGRSDSGTGFSSVNAMTGSRQVHNRTTLDASLTRAGASFIRGT